MKESCDDESVTVEWIKSVARQEGVLDSEF